MANTCIIQRDAGNKKFVIKIVDEDGELVTEEPAVELALGEVEMNGEAAAVTVRFGRIHYKDRITGDDKVVVALVGPVTDDTSVPADWGSGNYDIDIGGGGGGGGDTLKLQSIVICVEGALKTISYYGLPPV